jgi:hypothetical protein
MAERRSTPTPPTQPEQHPDLVAAPKCAVRACRNAGTKRVKYIAGTTEPDVCQEHLVDLVASGLYAEQAHPALVIPR